MAEAGILGLVQRGGTNLMGISHVLPVNLGGFPDRLLMLIRIPLSSLKPQSEEGAEAPLCIMYGKALLVADVGEIVNHRGTEEHVVPVADNSATPGDDDLGEVVVKGYARVAESH